MLPGCSVREVEGRLQISRPDGGACIWLAAHNSGTEFDEWRELLETAANKQRSRVQVLCKEINLTWK